MSNLNEFKMPRFFIDSVNEDGHVIPGIKRMYEIALRIHDSIMQWGGPGIGKSQAVQQYNLQKVEVKAELGTVTY